MSNSRKQYTIRMKGEAAQRLVNIAHSYHIEPGVLAAALVEHEVQRIAQDPAWAEYLNCETEARIHRETISAREEGRFDPTEYARERERERARARTNPLSPLHTLDRPDICHDAGHCHSRHRFNLDGGRPCLCHLPSGHDGQHVNRETVDERDWDDSSLHPDQLTK